MAIAGDLHRAGDARGAFNGIIDASLRQEKHAASTRKPPRDKQYNQKLYLPARAARKQKTSLPNSYMTGNNRGNIFN
jgi:hypothetical protein